jgi:hypothetical protein
MLCNSPRAIGPAETTDDSTIGHTLFRQWSNVQIFTPTQLQAMLWQTPFQRVSRVLTMFRYLVVFGATFYVALLIGGEDRGQQRMGLQGAYDVALAPALPTPEPETDTQIAATPAAPTDTLRILPAPDRATIQPASLTNAAPEPAFNDFNNPTVTLRYITADAANVRDAASRTGSVIDRVERGEIVQLVEVVGDWVHIRIEGDGIDGFVHSRLISSDAPSLSTLSLGPSGD